MLCAPVPSSERGFDNYWAQIVETGRKANWTFLEVTSTELVKAALGTFFGFVFFSKAKVKRFVQFHDEPPSKASNPIGFNVSSSALA
jgi:hypothetical protein